MKQRVNVFVITLLFSSVVISDDLGECQKIFALSQSALSNKAKGISKDRLVSALPTKQAEKEPEPLRSMREIVEEVYSYQITNHFAYSVYRSERCVLRQAGQLQPIEFGDILIELNSCNEAPECAMNLAGSRS